MVCLIALTATESPAENFIRADGIRFADQWDDTVVVRGIGLSQPPTTDLARVREDVRKIAAMGANCVRVDMDFRWFEASDGRGRFAFVDSIVQLAARQDLLVILSLDRRPGSETHAKDADLWEEDQENQDRLVDLWMSIAEHFRGRPEIAGYHLMRDPAPPDAGSYVFFMQYLIDSIREVDTHHVIIVPEPRTPNGLFDFGVAVQFLYDNNLAYGFTEYEPEAFTRQGLAGRPVGVPWPGEILESVERVGAGGPRTIQDEAKPKPLKLESIAPDGAQYVSPRVSIVGVGRASFEKIVLEEIAVFEQTPPRRLIYADTFSDLNTLWHPEPPGGRVMLERGSVSGEGRLVLETIGNLLTAQPYTVVDLRRLPRAEPNRRYRLTAKVSVSETAEAGIGMVFLKEKKYFSGVNDLISRLEDRAMWAKRAKAPLVLIEFAAPLQAPEKSELAWIKTVTDAVDTYGISWMYRTLREFDDPLEATDRQSYGIYWGTPNAPIDSGVMRSQLHATLLDALKYQPATGVALGRAEPDIVRNNPVPPPERGCWFGAQSSDSPTDPLSPTTFHAIMRVARRLNRLPAWIPVFRPWKDEAGRWTEFPEDEFREISSTGATPFIMWESRGSAEGPAPGTILEGHADTHLRAWADAARRYETPFVMRLDRGTEAAVYRHVQNIFDARGAYNISWMWAPIISTESTDRSGSDTTKAPSKPGRAAAPAEDLDYPWDARVDWIGFSIYDRPRAEELTAESGGAFPIDEIVPLINAVQKYNKPVCLAEAACESVKGQGEWWADALQKLTRPELAPIRAVVLMESVPALKKPAADFRLRNDAAYFIGKELSKPYFVGGD